MSIQKIAVEDFKVAVVDASMHQPVLVFFTAEACEPCDQVEQALRTLAERYHPRMHIAIVEVSEPEWDDVLEAFEVNSIPDLKVVHQRQRVAQAKGVLSLDQIETLIAPYVLSEKQFRLQQLERQLELLLSLEQFEEALEVLTQYTQQHPEDEEAQIYRVGILVRVGETQAAQELIDQMPESLKQSERLAQVQSALKDMQNVTVQ